MHLAGVLLFYAFKIGDEMKLFGLKNCDTCRKALKMLPEIEFADVRADGVPQDVMARAYEQFGAALLNSRSTTWCSLDQIERETDPLTLLAKYPALMKRPLIVDGDRMHLGWDAKVRAALGIA